MVIDYCLLVIDYQRVKALVKDFSLKNSFGQIVLFNLFFEKFFSYLSWCFSWGSCISWVFSWIFTWILILDWMTLWFLKFAWILILDLSLWHHQNKLGSFASTIQTPEQQMYLTCSWVMIIVFSIAPVTPKWWPTPCPDFLKFLLVSCHCYQCHV